MSNVALMSHALEEARSVGAAANQVSAAPLGAAAAEPMPTRQEYVQEYLALMMCGGFQDCSCCILV